MNTYTQEQIAEFFAEAEALNADIEDVIFRTALKYAYLLGRFGIEEASA